MVRPIDEPIKRYVDLLKKSLMGLLNVDADLQSFYVVECARKHEDVNFWMHRDILVHWASQRDNLISARMAGLPYAGDLHFIGSAHTMLGSARMDNIAECLDRIVVDGVPGDVIECGVWRGGATVFMRGWLAAHGVGDRTVWVADSFEGFRPPTAPEDAAFDLSKQNDILAIPLERVQELFARYGLLDDQVRFVKGWFGESLPRAPIARLSMLRVDGDYYESTRDVLAALYDKVSPGGFVIVDDYGLLPQCKQATDEFRAARGITDPIVTVDFTAVYWRKGER